MIAVPRPQAYVQPAFMRVLTDSRAWLTAALQRVMPKAAAREPRWPALSPVANGIERVVRLLDSAVPIPGTRLRVGVDPLLGLAFPVLGDSVSGAVSLGVMFLAVQYRVPRRVIAQMTLNVAVDVAVGSIPIVGDVFDFGWKANERNFALLMEHRGDLPRRASWGYWLCFAALVIMGLVCVVAPVALIASLALL